MSHKRGRKWYPKYPCRCQHCGWAGQRTGFMMTKACPYCGRRGVEEIVRTEDSPSPK